MFQEVSMNNKKFNIFMGFDGFVDKILRPVKEKNCETTVMFQTMQEFSEYLNEKSGKSCSIDMELVQTKIGGNVPIVANALGNLGCHVTCVGAFGYPEIHPIFEEMSDNCSLNSVAEPGYCSALEFDDGKLMLSTNSSIDSMDYKKIVETFTEKKLEDAINASEAVAFLNWGELLCSNDIWGNILTNIIPKCKFTKKKIMLVDFSDFSKRSTNEVKIMIEILKGYANYFDITVSVNENEMDLFFDKLGESKENMSLELKAVSLAKRFQCKNLVVHLLEQSCYVTEETVRIVKKEVVKDPRIITGGGDNFNAGLLLGLLLGFDIEKAIHMGSAMSCLYVKKGKNINLSELVNYELEKRR